MSGRARKIFVAGHGGMVGSAIVRCLIQNGVSSENIITRSRAQLDLKDQSQVNEFFLNCKPDQVYLAAALVGGIYANKTYPADFILQNLLIQTNVINAAFNSGCNSLLSLGSSCIYPKYAPQPMSEEDLLTGALEETNEPYAIAKIAGLKLCSSFNRQYSGPDGVDYRCVMPTNLYGLGDNYHPENAHVIPSLIRKLHFAKVEGRDKVDLWGTGRARREFLYVDDLAAACVQVLNAPKNEFYSVLGDGISHINVGSGVELEISDLARTIADVVGFKGEITFDATFPDGAPRKLLNSTRVRRLHWAPKIDLCDGLRLAYNDFLSNLN